MMSSAREDIIARLVTARPPRTERPERMRPPPEPDDPIGFLRERLREAGGRFQRASRVHWPDQIEWPIARSALRDVYSSVPEIESCGLGRSAESGRDLDGLEICVLRAEFAVVENGAVWHVPSLPHERAAALLAEHLIVVVGATGIVASLHEAYQRIESQSFAFGWFLCGPSKTADIEQSLVLGAHGPRTMNLIVTDD